MLWTGKIYLPTWLWFSWDLKTNISLCCFSFILSSSVQCCIVFAEFVFISICDFIHLIDGCFSFLELKVCSLKEVGLDYQCHLMNNLTMVWLCYILWQILVHLSLKYVLLDRLYKYGCLNSWNRVILVIGVLLFLSAVLYVVSKRVGLLTLLWKLIAATKPGSVRNEGLGRDLYKMGAGQLKPRTISRDQIPEVWMTGGSMSTLFSLFYSV